MARNLGQQYEDYVKDILHSRQLLPALLHGNDAGFVHAGVPHYVEVKNINAPDFGQKGMVWSQSGGWQWRERDVVSEMFDFLGVMNHIDKTFVPRRYSVAPERLTPQDKSFDQTRFEKRGIELDISHLYEFYARKNCNYIQVEGRGFYFLKHDPAGLGVPPFHARLTLRLRAKTHHSHPIHNYSFFAVIQAKKSTIYRSTHDLEELIGVFPPITK